MFVFTQGDGTEMLRITADRQVIVAGDIYQAAVDFWDCLATVMAQYGYELKRSDVPETRR